MGTRGKATARFFERGNAMGTRADFYVGRGPDAEWLGSIAWDGYPSAIGVGDAGNLGPGRLAFLSAGAEHEWRNLVAAFLAVREDATKPEDGWSWPWKDSSTTDYAYAFDGGKVYASSFGHAWFDPLDPPTDEDGDLAGEKSAVFPDMSARKAVTFGKRSGVLILGGSK